MLAEVKIDGKKVREARERAFLSKRELADEAGLDRSTVWRIEDGITEVYPRTIRKIAKALSVDPASLTPKD
jgi:transcriptional regulator with XRE-family HTH domain